MIYNFGARPTIDHRTSHSINRRVLLTGLGALALSTPAVAQSILSIFPQNYGLAPDGSDCSAGISQMIDDASSSGRVIVMTEGQWTCLSPIVKPAVAGKVRILGSGRDNSQIVWPNGGGLSLNYLDITKPPEIEKLGFITGAADGVSAGLTITTAPRILPPPPTAAPTYGGPRLEELLFTGTDPTKGWWQGVVIKEAWFPRLYDIYIMGIAPLATSQQTMACNAGIILYNTQAPVLVRPKIFWVQAAIWTQGNNWNEGWTIEEGELTAVGFGVADQSTFPRGGIEIAGLHINAYACAIQSNIRGNMSIHDCLLFMNNYSVCPSFRHIWLSGGTGNIIHDNSLFCPAVSQSSTASAVGVQLDNAPATKVHDNQFGYWAPAGTGIVLTGNSVNCEIYQNTRSESLLPPPNFWVDLSRAPTSNRIWGNAPDQAVP